MSAPTNTEVHKVRVHPVTARLPREAQPAWKLAAFAAAVPAGGVDVDVADMVACRVVDNAAVALAAIDRAPQAAARAMALAHPRAAGATLFGLPPTTTVHAEWVAWANGTAVRELDFHDTFLAADYAHPADSIPPLVAVAQQKGLDGARLLPSIAAACEVHVSLESYRPEHAHRSSTVVLWRKTRTVEDPAWTERCHDPDPARQAFGGRVDVTFDDGTVVSEERLVADAHPNGRRPWRWPDYLGKLEQLADGRLPRHTRERFVHLAARLGRLSTDEVRELNPPLPSGTVVPDRSDGRGIF